MESRMKRKFHVRFGERTGKTRLLQSRKVHPVPTPHLMALVPENERETLLRTLTEGIVEAYYTARGTEIAEFSYVIHDRWTNVTEDSDPQQQLHSHIVLPATVPTVEGKRDTFDNRANKGHIQLLHDISTEQFAAALDQHIGPDWRQLRLDPEILPADPLPDLMIEDAGPGLSELDRWFGREVDR